MPMARVYEPTVATVFQKCRLKKPSPVSFSGYTTMRRGWPCRPRMCIGPNVRFMPMTMNQKFHLPSVSLSILPNIFGHQ